MKTKKQLFTLHSPFKPAGSQPEAIKELIEQRPGISTLIGVTGSGKTFTIANLIASQDKPVLILAPNKTLAAQLYEEFSLFFPDNKVCYFVSYYDYYQPESYLPAQDIYIPKETKINSEIERLRVESAASLINRRDTIVIASVSCIYSLGDPNDYRTLALSLTIMQKMARHELIHNLIAIQYKRNDLEKSSGTFQVMGNVVEVQLPYQKEKLRVEIFGDVIEGMWWVSKQNNVIIQSLDNTVIFPAKYFVTTQEKREAAIRSIENELEDYLPRLSNPLYRERLKTRVSHDIEMIRETGYCSGVENYTAHFEGRKAGTRPFCLFDYFGDDFLLVVDESHIAVPQLGGMYAGDRVRKKALIDFGFRLPSAYENRPLMFQEIEQFFKDTVFVSATPGDYELERCKKPIEQIIRPTGLVDPEVIVHGRVGQIDNLVTEIKKTTDAGNRTLVTVLTKKMAEEFARFLQEKQIKVCYLHSDLKTPQRTELLQKLRAGIFDCLVGVNLLREGLDLPEVALVAIMDADVESFLRDKRSLIQIIGRAARNTQSKVIVYADTITGSLKAAMDETHRRRMLQQAYNTKHGITPQSVKRDVVKSIVNIQEAIAAASAAKKGSKKKQAALQSAADIQARIIELEAAMQQAADNFDFEKAIALRDEWMRLKAQS